VIAQLDILRGGLRNRQPTNRKLSVHFQKVDSAAVLRKLATIRAERKEVRDEIKSPNESEIHID
jgi:hypothetical protein